MPRMMDDWLDIAPLPTAADKSKAKDAHASEKVTIAQFNKDNYLFVTPQSEASSDTIYIEVENSETRDIDYLFDEADGFDASCNVADEQPML